MSRKVYTMVGKSNKPVEELLSCVGSSVNGEVVVRTVRGNANYEVGILVLEKYYFRNDSYANLTVVITDDRYQQIANIIGSGGGNGLFNISWGANDSFAYTAVRELEKHGFRVLEE